MNCFYIYICIQYLYKAPLFFHSKFSMENFEGGFQLKAALQFSKSGYSLTVFYANCFNGVFFTNY